MVKKKANKAGVLPVVTIPIPLPFGKQLLPRSIGNKVLPLCL